MLESTKSLVCEADYGRGHLDTYHLELLIKSKCGCVSSLVCERCGGSGHVQYWMGHTAYFEGVHKGLIIGKRSGLRP